MSYCKNILFILTFTTAFIPWLFPQAVNPDKNGASIKFDQIGLEQGLSQSTVYAITQDKQGFMWFGTDDGLNRFDGYSVKVFKNNPSDSNSVSDNCILHLLCDDNGDLWIGTRRGGLNRYVPSENKFYHFNNITGNFFYPGSISITSIFIDSRKTLWVGTKNGLYNFDKTNREFIRSAIVFHGKLSGDDYAVTSISENYLNNLFVGTSAGLYKMIPDSTGKVSNLLEPVGLDNYYIRFVFTDGSGLLWIGTFGKGLYYFNKAEKSFRLFTGTLKDSHKAYPGNFISCLYEDSGNNFWVAAYDSGFWILNRQTGNFDKCLSEPAGAIFEDNSGIIWIGTYTDGVKTYNPRENRFKHYYDDAPGLNQKDKNLITSLLEDKKGDLFVGTYNYGLKIYSPPDKNSTRYKIRNFNSIPGNPYSISSNRIISLSESSQGDIWIGTENDGLNRYDSRTGRFYRFYHNPTDINSPASNRSTSIFYDKENDLLWIGYLEGNIDNYHIKSGSFKHYNIEKYKNPAGSINSVTLIFKGKQTGLWAGTFEGELNRFNPHTDSFDRINFKPAIGSGTIKNGIYSLFEDDEGILWIGTYGGGLSRFDVTNDSVKTFTEVDGLSNNVVYGILPDNLGNLWLSTNKGISKFDPKAEIFKNFDVSEGLQSNEFNQGAYFRSTRGELFFGGVNGFNAFYPEKIEENSFVPPVHITSVKVFDKVLPLPDPIDNTTEKIELYYSQNFFSFEFTALNYTSPEKNQYAYMLDGFDLDWHYVDAAKRYASYTNLYPGEYVLRVKGSNNDGIWNEKGVALEIIIKPPFWMTWWFRGIIIIFIVFVVAATVRYFVRKKIKERTQIIERETALERERLRIARDMHDDLGARLTEIRYLTEIKQINAKDNNIILEKVSEVTKDIISTFNEIVWSVSPQNDTLENLAEFIGQYAVDYLSKVQIRCRLDIPAQIPNIEAPAEIRHSVFLAVKEALNNAVKYADTKEVHIKVGINDSITTVTIQDFGKGFDLSETNKFRNGLRNMKSRMKNIGGNFQIESQTGVGTKIIFQFPVKKEVLISD